MTKKTGRTFMLKAPPSIVSFASVVGKKEGEGPLGAYFDYIEEDSYFGEKSWEKAEGAMLKKAFTLCLRKGGLSEDEPELLFSGDLLNQCMSSALALRGSMIPFFGLYGACSTMGESLILAAMAIDGGFVSKACALSSSHFCSSERQFRFPLEYGGQRTPTSQWTVTGAGACALGKEGSDCFITAVTPGRIIDAGILDANNMGAAMAPAAYDSLSAHFKDTGRSPDYYDLIVTGDLGKLGHDSLEDLFRHEGKSLGKGYTDCGILIFDDTQDAHAGGSGCGCSASVLSSYILKGMKNGLWQRVLFAPTGALMSPTSTQQGESISGICHAVAIENSLDG